MKYCPSSGLQFREMCRLTSARASSSVAPEPDASVSEHSRWQTTVVPAGSSLAGSSLGGAASPPVLAGSDVSYDPGEFEHPT